MALGEIEMDETDWESDLADLLSSKGHNAKEIQKIVARVRQYETEMQVDSVMDSIDAGRFDLAAIIAEALREPDLDDRGNPRLE
jgi:hypothetical protein